MSEMNLSEAVAEAAKWGNLIRALSKIQDVAQCAVALEQNRSELQRAVDALKADLESTKAANVQAQQDLEHAQSESARVVRDANSQAAQIVSGAQAEAQRVASEALVQKHAAADELQGLTEQAQAARKDIDGAHAELVTVQQQIEEAKAAARARFA